MEDESGPYKYSLDELIDLLKRIMADVDKSQYENLDPIIKQSIDFIIGNDGDSSERLTGKKAEDVLTVNPIELFGDLKSAADKMAVDKSKLEDKPDSFELKIIKIQRRELAELNQEFFDKAFHEKGVSDVDSAKQEVEKQMQEYFSNDGQFVLYNDFIQWMFDNTKINLPDDFLRKWLHSINENKPSMEEIDKELVNVKNKLQTEIISTIGQE
jgi:trigger factor